MDITRSLGRHGNVQPAVFSLLAGLAPGSVKHAEHGLRPPGGIYNVSVARVLRAFDAILDQLDALGRIPESADGSLDSDGAALLAAQVELLEAMVAYIDDGYQILKACHPPDPTNREAFAHKWLEKARHPSVRGFKNAVSAYREAVAPIVNHIKHEHGRLSLVVFHNGEQRIAGYFLQGVDRSGAVGPDARIHPGDTAFSFNRDLRLHFVHIFEIGSALNEALKSALRAQDIRLTGRTVADSSASLISVAERVSSLGNTVFPDEAAKPTPHVRVTRDGDDVELAVRYPSLAAFSAPTTMRVMTTIHGDGFTTTYRMPYFPKQPAR